jgi:hypothetical protein
MTTRTVGELTYDLRERADLRGQTLRHPDSQLRRLLTQSLRACRAWVTRAVSDTFIVGSAPVALPTSAPTAGEQFLEVAFPPTAVSVLGIDTNVGGRWVELEPVRFMQRRDFQSGSASRPRAYSIRTLPSETPATTLTAGAIQIYPLVTTGLSYRIWYLPEFPELEDPDHVVSGFDGDWLEWALWDSTIKLAAEDDDSQNVDQIATRERQIVQDRVIAGAVRIQRAGPIAPTRSRSAR